MTDRAPECRLVGRNDGKVDAILVAAVTVSPVAMVVAVPVFVLLPVFVVMPVMAAVAIPVAIPVAAAVVSVVVVDFRRGAGEAHQH